MHQAYARGTYPGTIRWLLFRWASYHEVDTNGLDMPKLDEALSQMHNVEEIMVETPNVECASPFIDGLPSVANKLRAWAMDDAREYAKTRSAPFSNGSGQFPVSPCWHDEI